MCFCAVFHNRCDIPGRSIVGPGYCILFPQWSYSSQHELQSIRSCYCYINIAMHARIYVTCVLYATCKLTKCPQTLLRGQIPRSRASPRRWIWRWWLSSTQFCLQGSSVICLQWTVMSNLMHLVSLSLKPALRPTSSMCMCFYSPSSLFPSLLLTCLCLICLRTFWMWSWASHRGWTFMRVFSRALSIFCSFCFSALLIISFVSFVTSPTYARWRKIHTTYYLLQCSITDHA